MSQRRRIRRKVKRWFNENKAKVDNLRDTLASDTNDISNVSPTSGRK